MLVENYLKRLEPIFAIPNLEEISVSKDGEVWVEEAGKDLRRIEVPDLDFEYWLLLADAIANKAGLFFCPEENPTVSWHLPNRHRFEATISDKSVLGGLSVTIRLYRQMAWQLSSWGLTQDQEELLKTVLLSGKSLAVSGGTSTGKTNFLKTLLGFIPKKTRVFAVEDTLEIDLSEFPTGVQFLTRRGGDIVDSQGFSFVDAARTLLRSNPSLVVVGELSPENTIPLLNMLNSGVQVLFTGHANSPEMLLEKFEQNAALVGKNIEAKDVLRNSLGAIVQLAVEKKEGQPKKRKISTIWTRESATAKENIEGRLAA